jgi:hypothetical protein
MSHADLDALRAVALDAAQRGLTFDEAIEAGYDAVAAVVASGVPCLEVILALEEAFGDGKRWTAPAASAGN